mgnify:CR=1 FL=1
MTLDELNNWESHYRHFNELPLEVMNELFDATRATLEVPAEASEAKPKRAAKAIKEDA